MMEERRVCGHTIMSPVQPYRQAKNGFIPYVGPMRFYAPVPCMRPVGHMDDHAHKFVWTNGQPSDSPK